jgi:hypothetical protein
MAHGIRAANLLDASVFIQRDGIYSSERVQCRNALRLRVVATHVLQ